MHSVTLPTSYALDASDLKARPPRHTVSPSLCAEGPLLPPPSSASPRRLTGSPVAAGPWLCLPDAHVSLNLLNVQSLSNQSSPHQAKWAKPCHHPCYQPRFTALGASIHRPTSRLCMLVKTRFPTYVTAGTAGHSEGCSSSRVTLWATRSGPQLCLD